MFLMQLQDDIFRVGVCTECKQEEILDSNRDICWDCWCLLDIVAHENLVEDPDGQPENEEE